MTRSFHNKILVDTSAWIALTVSKDSHHGACKKIYKKIKNTHSLLVTTDAIFSETMTRLRYDAGFPITRQFYQTIEFAIHREELLLLWTTRSTFSEAWKIMQKFHEHRFSFVDCLSVAHAHSSGIKRIFSLDRDFVILGFTTES